MSYILEALKKADAERRKEKVPGIHTQPLPAAPVATDTSQWRRPAVWIGVAAVTVTAAAVGTLWGTLWTRPQTAAPIQVAQAPVQTMPAPAPAPSPSPSPVIPTPVAEPPAHRADASARPPLRREHEPKAPKDIRKETPATIPATPAEARVPTLHELPDAIRREIPEMKIGGYILGDNPADRSVLINNRLVHEGEEPSPGIVLERMQKNGMILRYKEYRFLKPY